MPIERQLPCYIADRVPVLAAAMAVGATVLIDGILGVFPAKSANDLISNLGKMILELFIAEVTGGLMRMGRG